MKVFLKHLRPLFAVIIVLLLLVQGKSSIDHASAWKEDSTSEDIPSVSRKMSVNDNVVDYHLWDSQEIHETLTRWKFKYPELVRVTTSQESYGLPTAGKADDCPFDGTQGCANYIMTIQDFVAHPEDSESSSLLPEVLWSGCVHGNERVGPTAVMEAATLLLEAAACEAKPRHLQSHVGHSLQNDGNSWDSQIQAGRECRSELAKKGINEIQRRWLARLVTTRRIVVVPTANALGYYKKQRTENAIDPNRDFPYDLRNAKDCMKTIAGRTLNEVFREHMFQLSLTFHGGMEVVSYEWGAPTWLGSLSPDHDAQDKIASAYSLYAGGFTRSGLRTSPYKYGTMNDLVYYVRGGMEDWAYAGSWDPERVIACDPETFGGYPKEKTIYNNSTLRVFNMLIEASNQKTPSAVTLGTSEDVLSRKTEGNGHISRNIRLALLAAEMVQPYVAVLGVNDLSLTSDVVPMVERGGRTCQDTKSVMVPGSAGQVTIWWTVGGAFEIDSTEIWYAKWDDLPQDFLDCTTQPLDLSAHFTKGHIMGDSKGKGYFTKDGASPTDSQFSSVFGPVFEGKITLSSKLQNNDKLVVIARARVDQSWASQPKNIKPAVPPQSHVVNARTNPNWNHSSAGKKIVGQLDWYSIPLTIVIGDYEGTGGRQGERMIDTIELSNRFGDTRGGIKSGITPNTESEISYELETNLLLMAVIGATTVMMVIGILRWRENREDLRLIINETEEEELTRRQNHDSSFDEEDFDHELELQPYPIQKK